MSKRPFPLISDRSHTSQNGFLLKSAQKIAPPASRMTWSYGNDLADAGSTMLSERLNNVSMKKNARIIPCPGNLPDLSFP